MSSDSSIKIYSVVWPAAFCLCRYLELFGVSKFCGKNVLEIGAGTGIASIVAALQGARVTATDQKSMLPLLRHNVGRHVLITDDDSLVVLPSGSKTTSVVSVPQPIPPHLKTKSTAKTNVSALQMEQTAASKADNRTSVTVCELSWDNQEHVKRIIADRPTSSKASCGFDWIIGSDLLYDGTVFPALLRMLVALCSTSPACTIALFFPRERSFIDDFMRSAAPFFDVSPVPTAHINVADLPQPYHLTIAGILLTRKSSTERGRDNTPRPSTDITGNASSGKGAPFVTPS